MANVAIENLTRQAIPILHVDVDDPAGLVYYIMTDRERVVMDEALVSQDITDKVNAGYLTNGATNDSPTATRFGA